MTLSRQHLLGALRAVEYPTRKPSSGQVALVRLCVGDGCLSAETVNESSRFTFGDSVTGRMITARYSALFDAVSSAPEDELMLTDEGSRLRVACAKFHALVAMEPADGWLERNPQPVDSVLTLKSKSLAELLKFTIQCAYKENGRPELESVILSASGGTLTTGSSNGRVIAISESECSKDGGARIHFKDAAEIVSRLEASSVALIGSTDRSTVVNCGFLRMEFAKPSTAIDIVSHWRTRALPGIGPEVASATFQKKRLCQAMEYGRSVAGDTIPVVNLRISSGLLNVCARGDNGFMSDDIEVPQSTGSAEISLSGKMIPPMLGAMCDETLRMAVHVDTPGALFSNGSQTLFACAMRAS